MSTIAIGGNATFAYNVDLRPLEAIPGSHSLVISSTFAGAKAPAPRVAFQTTLDRAGLLALCGLIDREVA